MRLRYPLTLTALALSLAAGLVIGDDDEHERDRQRGHSTMFRQADFSPAQDPTYRSECGGCHFAYPPGLLPARSWEALLDGLGDHFGDNAELSDAVTAQLRGYLTTQAADSAEASGRAPAVAASIPASETPLRFTATRYFQRKHHEIDPRTVHDNPQVGSLSACAACHTQADAGSFDEHQVRIPGMGRWED